MKKKIILIFIILMFVISFIKIPNIKANPDSITYAYPTITVLGFNSTNQCTMWDIWNASNSNGWNVIGKTGTSANTNYDLLVDIVFGDGSTSTYFADSNINLHFNTTWAGVRSRIQVKNNANVTLGKLVDSVTKRTTEGVNIISGASSGGEIIDVDSGGILNLYGCHLTTLTPDYLTVGGNVTIYESLLTNIGFTGITASTNMNVYRTTLEGASDGVTNPTTKTTFDNVFIHSMTNAIAMTGSVTSTFINLLARNNTKIVRTAFWSGNLYLIDSDVDIWTFTWLISTGEINRQYTFDLIVTYPNGTAINGTETGTRVTIQHYGNNSGIDYNGTLNGDGTINQTALTMGFYNQTNGDNIYNCNPFNIHIYNTTGFNEYNGNFTLNGKEDLTIILTPSVIDYTVPIALLVSFGLIISMLVIAKIKR